jgi:SAM-dependent methyltransferase
MRQFIKKIPIIGKVLSILKLKILGPKLFDSGQYWEERYLTGGNSGSGSYGRLALFKAEVLNKFVADQNVRSIIELGCGDGHQLSLAIYPAYLGLDVSASALQLCRDRFKNDATKSFQMYDSYSFRDKPEFDLALSLDVIYHLVEDSVFESYMSNLFQSAKHFVVIYSSNSQGDEKYHERKRNFSDWIKAFANGWELSKKITNPFPYHPADPDNTSQSDFYFYQRKSIN